MATALDYSSNPPAAGKTQIVIALAGNPNSGKTTVFNALTGLRQKVANYPGVTVEKKTGRCTLPDGRAALIIDLPGTYSLISRSPDEQVAMEVLRGIRADTPMPDAVIAVVDASNLQRNLYLVSQLIELGRPLVIALNMMDVAERRGLHVDPSALSRELGVPVVALIGHKREGIDQLLATLAGAKVAPMPDFPLPPAMKEELLLVGGGLAILDSGQPVNQEPEPQVPLGHAAKPRAWICRDDVDRRLDRYQALAERLLIGDAAADIDRFQTAEPVGSLLTSARHRLGSIGIDPMQADIEAHYRWIESVVHKSSASVEELAAMGTNAETGVLAYETPRKRTLSDRADQILVHKVWGLVIFALIMGALFVSIFWLAKAIMDFIQEHVVTLGAWATQSMADGSLKSLIKDGIFAGVGAVVVFVPQIALLFMFLAILEDSGYLARAAFLMDRLLSKVGLHGKSFIPLLSSFACAIPGIMATRTMESRKDRLATILVAPFMSCSARLPVYTLLIGTFFWFYNPLQQAGIMLACYALGIVAAVVTAFFFKRTFLKGTPTSFILELPTYKLPQWDQVLRQMWTNSRQFLTKAGTTIFFLSILLWAMSYYPQMPQAKSDAVAAQVKQQQGDDVSQDTIDNATQAAQSEYSIAGRMGHAMEPVIRPLGFDWKMGVGLVGAFAAREVFVSTMGITYAVGDTEKNGIKDLSEAMRGDHYPDGHPVWTPLVAVSLLVWFVLAMQCISTVAVVRRETGGWGWPLFMVVYMNVLAYVASLAVFQIGKMVA